MTTYCQTCCPQPVDVTINNYTLQMDDLSTYWRVDSSRTGTVTIDAARLTLLLSAVPISEDQLVVEIGGTAQLNGTDFTLDSDVITLTDAVPAGVDVTVRYLSATPGVSIPGSPIGSIIAWMGGSLPYGYLECDGSAISRTTYAFLFSIVGITYGAGDGLTTFNLPNCTMPVLDIGTNTFVNRPAIIKV